MLQTLREHVQGWIAATIAGVLCLAFALWGIEYYISGTTNHHPVVAKVNGVEITQDQWDTAYNRAHQSQPIQINNPELQKQFDSQIKTRTLNGLIQEQVLLRAAQQTGYVISAAQIGKLIQQMPAFQVDKRFSYPLFQRTLQNLSYTPENFSREIAKSTLLQQVQQNLVASNFTLPTDVDRYILLQDQKRSFGYSLISPIAFLTKVTVKNQDISDYYKTHAQDFVTTEKVSLQYLLLSTEEANKKVVITEQELQHYYEENKAAFKSAKTAEIAKFATVKAQIEKTLRQQKVEAWVAAQSDKLANLTYTHPDTLKIAADALGLKPKTTALFTRQGEKTGLLSNPKIITAAFSDNVLKQKNNSDVISLDDHTILVLRIAEHQPPVTRPLAEVRADIEKILAQKAASDAAADVGEKIVQQLKKGGSPTQLAAQYKLKWVVKDKTSRKAKDVPPQILNLAFNQPAPLNQKNPVIVGKKLSDGGYAVLALTAMIEGNLTSADAAQRKALQKQMENDFGMLDYDLYLLEQTNHAKIKIIAEQKSEPRP